MSDSRLREGARLVRDADDVLLHVGPELLAGADAPADDLAKAIWSDPDGSFSIDRFEEQPECVWDDWLDFWADAGVDPTAENARHAVETGADLLAIGERPTPMDGDADYRLREDPTGALARLRDAVAILQ